MIELEEHMREWLMCCFTDEYDQELIDGLDFDGLVKSINQYYDGGMREFKNNACLWGV